MAECECKDWKENIGQINNVICMDAIRNGGSGYTGKPIKYCMWCGKLLDMLNLKEWNSKKPSVRENEKN